MIKSIDITELSLSSCSCVLRRSERNSYDRITSSPRIRYHTYEYIGLSGSRAGHSGPVHFLRVGMEIARSILSINKRKSTFNGTPENTLIVKFLIYFLTPDLLVSVSPTKDDVF